MAFPVVESVTQSVFNTAATSHPVTMPATVNAGDLLIAVSGTASGGYTGPTGWTPALHQTTNGAEIHGNWYKIADGTEAGTTPDWTTVAGRKGSFHVYRITAWHGTTPPEIGTAAAGTSVSPDPPTLTPSWGAADTLWLATAGINGNNAVSAYPTNYTNGIDDQCTGTGANSLGSCRRELNTATEDPAVFTSGNVAWVAQTIAIRPADAGVTGTVAVTQDAQTSTASGTVANPVTGNVAVTQADQTSTAAGAESFTGSSAAAQADQTSTASGTETISGTSATTQDDQTSTASAVMGSAPSGTLAETQDDQTSTASGTVVVVISGTVAVTQADQTSTATAFETFTGTSVNIQADQGAGAVGVLGFSGTSTATQADQTSTATGTALFAVIGTVAVVQADQFSTASGIGGILTFWSPNPVGYTVNPVSHVKAPVAFVKVGAGDDPPW